MTRNEKAFVRGFAYSFVLDRIVPGGSIFVLLYGLLGLLVAAVRFVVQFPMALFDYRPFRQTSEREPNTKWDEYKKYLQG